MISIDYRAGCSDTLSNWGCNCWRLCTRPPRIANHGCRYWCKVCYTYYYLLFPCLNPPSSIWMKRALAQFHHPQHAQAGENPELRALFYRLCHILRRPITAVFVFDGPQRATYKRDRLVVTQPIWITQLFQAFIAAFGFHSHTVRRFFKSAVYWFSSRIIGTWRSRSWVGVPQPH